MFIFIFRTCTWLACCLLIFGWCPFCCWKAPSACHTAVLRSWNHVCSWLCCAVVDPNSLAYSNPPAAYQHHTEAKPIPSRPHSSQHSDVPSDHQDPRLPFSLLTNPNSHARGSCLWEGRRSGRSEATSPTTAQHPEADDGSNRPGSNQHAQHDLLADGSCVRLSNGFCDRKAHLTA